MLMNWLNALSRTKIVFIYNNKTQRQQEWKRTKKNKNKINNNKTKIVSTNKNACVMYQINAVQLIDIALFSSKYIFLASKCASSKLQFVTHRIRFSYVRYVYCVKFSSFVRFLLCQTISITCVWLSFASHIFLYILTDGDVYKC